MTTFVKNEARYEKKITECLDPFSKNPFLLSHLLIKFITFIKLHCGLICNFKFQG